MKKKIDIPYLICLAIAFIAGIFLSKLVPSDPRNVICGVIIGKIIYHFYQAYKGHKSNTEHEE